MKFPANVVMLRALILHHFNYILITRKSEVPESLWDSMSNFISPEIAADSLKRDFAIVSTSPVDLVIDRHAAQRLVLEGHGNAEQSIVWQVATSFQKFGPQRFQLLGEKIWRVRFVMEDAIDAGGPSRELMTELASSIFEPTSQLFIQAADAKHFVPATANRMWSIGVYLGLVIRTGLPQDLPFAPFIWKYFAHELITINDFCEIDLPFSEAVKNPVSWTVKMWNGRIRKIPGHGDVVNLSEITAYVNECFKARMSDIRPALKEMRRGFRENLGIGKHRLMTSQLLSKLAQGNPTISVDELLQKIEVSSDFPEGLRNPFVQRFFRVVSRFTDEQRVLLLRFITTQTRLPNLATFRIRLGAFPGRSPDQLCPTATTCFNRLHLPQYSSDDVAYRKILTAIQFCNSMEIQ
jgi:hypothetical protein